MQWFDKTNRYLSVDDVKVETAIKTRARYKRSIA